MGVSELVYVRKSGIAATTMDGETVMMDVDHGKYFGISGVGQLIWNLLSEKRNVGDLVDRVCEQYDVEASVARADVEKFLGQLLARQLIDRI